MTGTVVVEIVGLKNSECSPFPCDENRTCGLTGCFPTGSLTAAYEELKKVLMSEYGNRVELKLTLIDDRTPDYIQKIIETEYPASADGSCQRADHPHRADIPRQDKKRD